MVRPCLYIIFYILKICNNMRHSVCGCVVLDAKKKSCGFVLSLTNFEVKKERKNFPAPHVLK
jgi:hypothetical protein